MESPYILETKWGYVVQTESNDYKNAFISLFYDNGRLFFPFTKLKSNKISGVYYKDIDEITSKYSNVDISKMIKEDKKNHPEFFNLFPYQVDLNGNINLSSKTIFYKELDERYFVLPIKANDKELIALFYMDNSNKVVYHGNIAGEVFDLKECLTKNKSFVVKNENNETIFSWEKNIAISDTWTKIVTIPFNILTTLQEIKNMIPSVRQYLMEFIKQQNAFLAILVLKSEISEEQMQFFAVIRPDGSAITDLMYITNTFNIETINLKGEPIGTIDLFREKMQERLNRRTMLIEQNKNNMLPNISMLIASENDPKLGTNATSENTILERNLEFKNNL